jgi:hypothetical protein
MAESLAAITQSHNRNIKAQQSSEELLEQLPALKSVQSYVVGDTWYLNDFHAGGVFICQSLGPRPVHPV